MLKIAHVEFVQFREVTVHPEQRQLLQLPGVAVVGVDVHRALEQERGAPTSRVPTGRLAVAVERIDAAIADRFAATGTRLKAIVISNADRERYMGAMAVVRRFPNTPGSAIPRSRRGRRGGLG